MKNTIIEKAIINLISDPRDKDNCFYGHIIAQCYINIDEKFDGIAGVGYWNDKFNLYINPDLFKLFSIDEQKAILIHEAMHIIFNHFSRQEEKDHEKWNIATDAAINQFIKNIPSNCILPETLCEPREMYAEFYYENISRETIKRCCNLSVKLYKSFDLISTCNVYKSIDNHELWNKSNNDLYTKEAVKNLLDNVIEKSMGRIPIPVQKALKLLSEESQIPWQKILRRIMSNSKNFFEPSYKKVNRRFFKRIDLPGKKVFYIPTLICIIDVSGSMTSKEIIKGIIEIKKICKITNHKLVLIQVDTKIQDITKTDFKNHSFTRQGNGGTDLYPAIEYIYEHKFSYDILVFITDGYFNFNSWKQIPKVPMFFLITQKEIELPTKKSYQFLLK